VITPATTPTELARRVGQQWVDAESVVVRLTALYCRGRFGVNVLSGEELRTAVEDLGVLKRLARQSR
jgi:hypothetical protein